MRKAAVPATKKKKGSSGGSRRRRIRAQDDGGEADLIRNLPDAILGTIISLLPTKDGHPGPARRFHYPRIRLLDDADDLAHIESWFLSRALTNLQELDISAQLYSPKSIRLCPLPSSVLRVASTLLVAKIGSCEIAHPLNLPVLKHLTLQHVSSYGSPTLRSIVLRAWLLGYGELVIEDAPRLESLLLPSPALGCKIIRVIRAPRLEMVGPLFTNVPEIHIVNQVSQEIMPVNLKNPICTVKVLTLQFSGPDLNAVLSTLNCFPCLEILHIIWKKHFDRHMENVSQPDPLDPAKCLKTHLKKLVLENYEGSEQEDVNFAKFFVLNAKELKEIKFGVYQKINKAWVADQHRLLEVETRASEDAQFEFSLGSSSNFMDAYGTMGYDLSIAHYFSTALQ
ncbi:hypothetical protein BRADI_2g36801v3 [Brachypodium distachyon]|uniref:Uncharacterized protein n=1 Tax=Brachypodium distachyon TaxID=15368 RepID=A0A0Q3MTI6_BRADI|nr:hypothetical protein BRADI_2g36801v3 [Brachypodium distachyon]